MPKPSPSAATIEQISRRRAKSLPALVAEAIEQMVISGELAAGDKVNESAVATRLDVSRGPVREACRSLEQAGLLTSEVNRGVFVRTVSLEEARNLYEVRAVLAGLTGRLAVQRATDKEVAAIVKLVDRMEVAAENADFDAYYSLNVDFHAGLLQAAGNPELAEYDNLISKQLHQHRRQGLAQRESLLLSNEEHRAIVTALTQRDETEADKAMRAHVRGGWLRVSATL